MMLLLWVFLLLTRFLLFFNFLVHFNSLIFCRFFRHLLLSLGRFFCLTKHIGKTELTNAVSIRNLTLSFAQIRGSLKHLVGINLRTCFFWQLIKHVSQIVFSENKIAFVRIVLNWSPKHHVALFERADISSFNKAVLEFKLIQKIVP